ncbi:hypothetical protein M426DRAFT_325301 [Hypoxylon sp. CI-4A]|nr:hypothetical protein M426DRAFT_325301 [Hypoxylon sp. CI-4A]
MRLINTDSLKLHEFFGSDVPRRYAILSHTWAKGEVSFQDFQAGRGPSLKGYDKILDACQQASRHYFQWIWVDTCCIDKTSSAELSEAINSMHQWYKDSFVCYAYISDLDASHMDFPWSLSDDGERSHLARWFTRSWTLQELIAPPEIKFYDRDWREIGCRSDEHIAEAVSKATRIPLDVIKGLGDLSKYSAAQKLSWASGRSCTRKEDAAYSLLGIFDISMPLLYGEGDKAFTRLQEEILRETDDNSLLCWTVPVNSPRSWTLESVFAKSPDDFSDSRNVRGHFYDSGFPSAVTNRGLQTHLHLTQRIFPVYSHFYHGNTSCFVYEAALNAAECLPDSDVRESQVSILLVRTPQISRRHSQSINRYARLATPTLKRIPIIKNYEEIMRNIENPRGPPTYIYIHKNLLSWEQDRFGLGGIHLQNLMVNWETLDPPVRHRMPGLRLCTIKYSGLEEEIKDLAALDASSGPVGEISWSPIYECIRFGPQLQKRSDLPYFVVFGMESVRLGVRFEILLAWTSDQFHFRIEQGKIQIPEPFAWDGIFNPSCLSTHQGDCWDTYGVLATSRALIDDYNTELVLEREDPTSVDGEAAGNRLHFLIHANYEDVASKKILTERYGYYFSPGIGRKFH